MLLIIITFIKIWIINAHTPDQYVYRFIFAFVSNICTNFKHACMSNHVHIHFPDNCNRDAQLPHNPSLCINEITHTHIQKYSKQMYSFAVTYRSRTPQTEYRPTKKEMLYRTRNVRIFENKKQIRTRITFGFTIDDLSIFHIKYYA